MPQAVRALASGRIPWAVFLAALASWSLCTFTAGTEGTGLAVLTTGILVTLVGRQRSSPSLGWFRWAPSIVAVVLYAAARDCAITLHLGAARDLTLAPARLVLGAAALASLWRARRRPTRARSAARSVLLLGAPLGLAVAGAAAVLGTGSGLGTGTMVIDLLRPLLEVACLGIVVADLRPPAPTGRTLLGLACSLLGAAQLVHAVWR